MKWDYSLSEKYLGNLPDDTRDQLLEDLLTLNDLLLITPTEELGCLGSKNLSTEAIKRELSLAQLERA